ncbi:GTP-binding protein [Castellaniella sp. GW247-6E4]|uniref:CobW family GTP-binding protein n=1 Tax=Castellaniella sp. GW247-6E4 TaxID=3140380 RepID=UPI003314DDB8
MSAAPDAVRQKIPVNVLTGFLGSGKTSLLRRLLNSAEFSNCAVLINELGEIGLDHELIDVIDQETVVLSSGCICCGIRSDLVDTLLELNEKRDRGLVPAFDRVVLETTGLADPVPVLNTIISDPKLHFHFSVGTIVATVDAVHGMRQLEEHPESVKQAAVTDRLVITKADLVGPGEVESLRSALYGINPSARVITSRNDAGEAEVLMHEDLGVPAAAAHEVGRWFAHEGAPVAAPPISGLFGGKGRRLGPLHASGIKTASLVFDKPLDWAAFGVWFSMLLHCHGVRILRVKGILNIQGSDLPTVVHGVQHLVHPPSHLQSWPSADRRSRLVLIGELPSTASLQQSLQQFMDL